MCARISQEVPVLGFNIVCDHSLKENRVGFVSDLCVCWSCALQATGLSADTMRVVLERCYNDLRLLCVPNKTLKAEGFFRSNKVLLPFF